jgi:FtsP/CotA-like multicopper oxidase with cupredoxin domain
MRLWISIGIGLLNLFCLTTIAPAAENSSFPAVVANNNRRPAGKLQNGILELRLELREGVWYPEADGSGHRDVYAFAEEGEAPQCPGPLIRVPAGTQIHIRLRNTLVLAAKIYGLHRHPGDPKDSLSLAPGETRELEFLAGDPGTYPYWGTTSDTSLAGRRGAETLLSGVLVVDPLGVKAEDRIFVLGVWTKSEKSGFEIIPWINGKSWPYTEHFTYDIGQVVRWRVVNISDDPHSMHLHGFFFTVEAIGDGEHYERYTEEQRRLAVTEAIESAHVFEMTWAPDRAGNWLFHCHMTMHMSVSEALHPQNVQSAVNPAEHEQMTGMGGLVIGITVLPGVTPVPIAVVAKAPRKLQLIISENPDKVPLYKLELNDPGAPAEPSKEKQPSLLGPLIVLTRGEATEIEVKNATNNPTAIHWHGIELESFYDGVPGWTGSSQQTTPPILPGSSFVARMIPPRAGTFIYHTHWHDETQLLNGMYGPLIVLEPGQKYDPEHDKTFVISTGRYAPFGPMLLVNGTPEPDPMVLKTATTYRLRLINITNNESDLRVRLDSKEAPVQWMVIAKDGADLPMAQRKSSPAEMGVTVGATYDVEYHSDQVGHAEMLIAAPGFEALIMQPLDFVSPK